MIQKAKRLFAAVGKKYRQIVYCHRGIHWRMERDDGSLPNDITKPGTCQDCGWRSPGVTWSHDNSDLIELLKQATNTVREKPNERN